MNAVTHIGIAHTVVGAVRAGEDLAISGRVQGRVDTEGALVIEAGAIVEGDVRAREVVVRGVVVGDIAAVEGLEITANGQILGNITTRRMVMRTGGRVSGEVTTGVEVQPFVYSERQGGVTARRGAPAMPPRVAAPLTARAPSFEERFAARAAEGARSWQREPVADEAPVEPAQPAAPAKAPTGEPQGEGR